jgi:Fe-S-cluster containining protein
MIAIENVLISDEVIEAKFVCDLDKCKGGCCEDGDAGAPLEKEERKILDKYFDVIKPYLTKEGLAEIQSQGRYLYDREFGWVTPTVRGKICAYGFRDDKGIIKCGIEQAYNDGKLPWKKPISCHLYPIKISKRKEYTNLNYEPRDVLCNPACALGKKLKVPVYQFLKEAIVRKFGEEFYAALHQVAVEHFQEEKSRK